MTLQERKDTADIIAKQSEVVNKKLFVYLAIAGGSWIYGTKESGYIGLFAFVLFMIVSVGVFVNLLKLSKIEKEIEELKKMNDIISILFPIGAIVAAVFAFIAYKNHWKIADIF